MKDLDARQPTSIRPATGSGFRWLLVLGSLITLLAAPAGAKDSISPDDVTAPVSWGQATRVTQLRHLYFADQPDPAGFEAAKQAGVTVVINLRGPGEIDWDEQAAVEKLGLAYYNVPVTGASFDPKAFDRIEELVARNEDEQILIHCGSSNRVGGWLATHLVTRHGLSRDEALAVGRRAGISSDSIVERVDAYLASQPQASH